MHSFSQETVPSAWREWKLIETAADLFLHGTEVCQVPQQQNTQEQHQDLLQNWGYYFSNYEPLRHPQLRDPRSSQPSHGSQQPPSPAHVLALSGVILLSETEDLRPFARTVFLLLQMEHRVRHEHTTKNIKKPKPVIALGSFCSKPNQTPPQHTCSHREGFRTDLKAP